MLDIKFIRENKDVVAAGAKKKHINFNVDELISVDDERRATLLRVEEKRAKQNAVSEKIPKATPEEKAALLAEMKVLKEDLQKDDEALREIMKKWQLLMVQVPNVPDMTVPDGDDDADNQEVKKWGEQNTFTFAAKNHIDLMKDLDMADFEKGAEVAGFLVIF